MALLANINRGKKSKPLKPADFNPFAKRKPKSRKMTRAMFDSICMAFMGAKNADR